MRRVLCTVASALVMMVVGTAHAGLVLDGGGLVLAEQGGTFDVGNLSPAGTAFALDELDFGVHYIVNVNNGTYGNSSSWIGGGATGTSGPFIGINLGGSTATLRSIAFGRSNVTSGDPCGGGVCTDRWPGEYTLQYTQVANPDESTPDGDWTDIGKLDYQSAGGAGFDKPHLRHRYNFDAVEATGIRLMVPGTGLAGGTAIDEIELYAAAGEIVIEPPPPPIVLTPEAGFSITWDGNEGDFFDPAAPPEQVGAPDNFALASHGATAFGSSAYPAPAHAIAHANDGYFGNSNSWLGILDGSDPNPFIGIDFPGDQPVAIESIAFGRDNGNMDEPWAGGQLTDRWQGLYTLQYTLVPDPDALTEFTADPATGWADIGTIELVRAEEPLQAPWLRHEFDVALGGGPILATGIRILAPMGNAIDELEVNPIPEPSTVVLLGIFGLCLVLCSLRRRGAA